MRRTALGQFRCDYPLPFILELVGGTLQEQHPEDVLLELRGVHLPAEDVHGREEVAFELGEGELAHAAVLDFRPMEQ